MVPGRCVGHLAPGQRGNSPGQSGRGVRPPVERGRRGGGAEGFFHERIADALAVAVVLRRREYAFGREEEARQGGPGRFQRQRADGGGGGGRREVGTGGGEGAEREDQHGGGTDEADCFHA